MHPMCFQKMDERLQMLNKNTLTKSDDDEIMNMLKLIKTKVDLNSLQLTEFKNTLI